MHKAPDLSREAAVAEAWAAEHVSTLEGMLDDPLHGHGVHAPPALFAFMIHCAGPAHRHTCAPLMPSGTGPFKRTANPPRRSSESAERHTDVRQPLHAVNMGGSYTRRRCPRT